VCQLSISSFTAASFFIWGDRSSSVSSRFCWTLDSSVFFYCASCSGISLSLLLLVEQTFISSPHACFHEASLQLEFPGNCSMTFRLSIFRSFASCSSIYLLLQIVNNLILCFLLWHLYSIILLLLVGQTIFVFPANALTRLSPNWHFHITALFILSSILPACCMPAMGRFCLSR
jgi:hypothetical protein